MEINHIINQFGGFKEIKLKKNIFLFFSFFCQNISFLCVY